MHALVSSRRSGSLLSPRVIIRVLEMTSLAAKGKGSRVVVDYFHSCLITGKQGQTV